VDVAPAALDPEPDPHVRARYHEAKGHWVRRP
jgi:hypothetical protein